jgi:hypothetical protein
MMKLVDFGNKHVLCDQETAIFYWKKSKRPVNLVIVFFFGVGWKFEFIRHIIAEGLTKLRDIVKHQNEGKNNEDQKC